MSEKEFINNLSSVQADIRKLDTKKIFLNNKDILEYIEENVPTVKHAQDTRTTVYEDDLWGQWVETKDDGTIVVHDDYLKNPNWRGPWNSEVKSVRANKAYTSTDASGSPLCNIQTERIKNGTEMFAGTSITLFNGDLSNLVDGHYMFNTTSLTLFSDDSNGSPANLPINLSNLVTGREMFTNTPLTVFSGDLSSLENGQDMFYNCTNLKSFNGNLNSLVSSQNMFADTSLTSFIGDLSSLVNGYEMFSKCKLNPQSVMYILGSLKNLIEEKAKYTSGEIHWVDYDPEIQKYSAAFGFMVDGSYLFTYKDPDPFYDAVSATAVGQLTLGIDVTNDPDTIVQQLQTFAEGCLYESWEKLKQAFIDKGWTVTFQYGGTDTEIILPEDE